MLPSFAYTRPATLAEAVKALADGKSRAHAGGTDLLGCLRDGVLSTPTVVSLTGLTALRGIETTVDGGLRIGALATPVSRAVCGMLGRPRPGSIERYGAPGHPLHDPCVIAYLLWPELFAGRDCDVAIETASEVTMGRSTIDWWGTRRDRPNAHVIGHVDAPRFFERLTASLAKL